MSVGLFKRAEEVYEQVAGLPEPLRARELERLCGTDPALRAEVSSLLEHATRMGEFLQTPALGSGIAERVLGDTDAGEDLAGQTIGPYKLEQRLAVGGMGAVYLAARADGAFRQQVAVKLVKRGMDSDEIVRRFRQERQTLAALNHPNIARLLDGGLTDSGRPYLVMEYVRGKPIDRYCRENGLTIEQRLRLFALVCGAVHYAHRNLVVHRDLKPGNIFIADDGTPKLLDFGIAKVLSEDRSVAATTIADQRRLTPEYASPEQLEGRVMTTAGDVYSLGVVLYELLTERRPHRLETKTTREAERIVLAETPAAPSELLRSGGGVVGGEAAERWGRRLRGDLDNIVLMALRKEPERRYASAEQFAADVGRYLDGLPVIARKDTLGYRIGKFVRRNAIGVALAATAAALLLGGVVTMAWQSRELRRQRDDAYVARDQSEAIGDFLRTMLSAADPINEGPDARVKSVLDAAASRVEADLKDDPLVQAAARSTIGRTYMGLGLYDKAREHIDWAFQTRRRLLDPEAHDLAESKLDMAELLYETGRHAEAERLLREALATHERLRGTTNIDTARVLNDLGAVLRAQNKTEEAEQTHRRALAVRRQIAGENSLDAAESLNNLAGVLRSRGDAQGAVEAMTDALRIRRSLLREDHPLVIQAMANLATMKAGAGDLNGAAELLRAVTNVDCKVFGEQHPFHATNLNSLASVLARLGKFAEAEPHYREAMEIRRLRLGADDERTLLTQMGLGRCLVQMGMMSEAERLLADVVTRATGANGAMDERFAPGAEDLAAIYASDGRSEKAAQVRRLLDRSR